MSRRKSNAKNKQTSLQKIVMFAVLGLGLSISIAFGIQYKDALLYYLGYKTKHKIGTSKELKQEEARIQEILENHTLNAIGIDVSEYQGKINWGQVNYIQNKYPISFVLVRATVGKDRMDKKYKNNWSAIKGKFIRGAYHYYRPNENSLEQARLFIETVQLQKGDFPPVLDIEKLPKTQSIDSLKVGLKRWLNAVEKHYKVKPIIYSGESYYNDFLEDEFSDYTFWIANYNPWIKKIDDEWMFWQFTEKATVKGINERVDVNIFDGNLKKLKNFVN